MAESPTDHQRQNLQRMTTRLAGNPRAARLAEEVWRFFGYRLLCSTDDRAETSRVRYGITDYAAEVKAASLTPSIQLAQSDRMEEALVHELLHLELLRRGYPRFFFDEDGCPDEGLARGITNCADHEVMLPWFLDLGYKADRFVTPGESSEFDLEMLRKIKALRGLETPAGYAPAVGACLREHGFSFQLTYVHP